MINWGKIEIFAFSCLEPIYLSHSLLLACFYFLAQSEHQFSYKECSYEQKRVQ